MESRPRTSETERRRATVLFTDITGFTALNERLDPEEAYGIVSACLMRLDAIARKHGGNVDKYLGDCILGVFGVPAALEDAPRAALNAAIEIHESVEAFNEERGISPPLRVHTGINTGLLISGEVSGPVIREFSVMGDTVNVAARLKDKAPPDRIWVGPETYEATRDLFEFHSLDAMELKGKAERLPVYELLSRAPRLHRPEREAVKPLHCPLVGRSAELDRLEKAVGGLRPDAGLAAVVAGEAGIGKSRLVSEVRRRREPDGSTWLLGRSVSVGGQLPLHPVVDLFQRWAGIRTDDSPEHAFGKLRRAVEGATGPDAGDVLPVLATLLGLDAAAGGAEPVAALEGEAMERALLTSVVRTLRHLAERGPLVVAFEDIHWADQSSLEFIESLIRRLAHTPTLFLLVTRPRHASVDRALAAIAKHTPLEIIELKALEPGATDEMLDHFAGEGDVAIQLRRRIEESAAGNPFFTEEIVRSLIEAGGLEQRDGGLWTTDRTAGIELPVTVNDLLAARLDRLEPSSREVVEAASVVGRSFRQTILFAVVPEAQARPALEHLVTAELLERRGDEGDRRFAFKHPLIQETAYGILSLARRRELHRRVADAIERIVAVNQPGRSGMLAYHLSLAGEAARAEKFLFRAGDEAARVAASSEALRFFQEAYRLYLANAGEATDSETLARLEQKIARAWFNRGELGEAADHFGLALEHLGVRQARGRIGLAWSLLRTVVVVVARLYAGRWLEGRRPSTDRDREIIAIMFDRSRAQTTGDPARFLHDSLENVRKVGSVDPRTVPGAGGMLAAAIGCFSFGGLSFAVGERFVRRSAELVDPEDLRETFLFHVMRFSHRFLLGDWSDALEIDPAEVEGALRLGQLWDATTYLGLLADKRIFQADLASGAEILERIGKIEAHYLYDLAASNRQFVTLLLHLERGDLEAAEAEADHHQRENEEALLRILSLGYLGKIRCLKGDLAGAREAVERGEMLVAEAGLVPPFQLGALVIGRARLDVAIVQAEGAGSGRGARAGASVRRACRLARKVAWHRPEAHRLRGSLLAMRGRRRAAARAFARSLEEASRLGMKLESARGWEALAESLGGSRFRGRDATACRAEAERIRSEVIAPRP